MSFYKQLSYYSFTAICIILFLTSCNTYYKAVQTSVDNTAQKALVIDSLKLQNRYFILLKGSQAFCMKDISLDAKQQTLKCILDTIPPYHQLYLSNKNTGKFNYYKADPLSSTVLSETLIYIRSDTTAVLGQYSLQLNNIQKIEIIEKDKKRTTKSSVMVLTSLAAGLALLIYLIKTPGPSFTF